MTQKLLALLLLLIFLASPLQAVFASEESLAETPETAVHASESETVGLATDIPIYFFADQYGGILGIAPVTDNFFLWAYAPFALSSSDISDLYTSHDPTNNASDLEGFWKFDGGYTDDSGNGNTLTGQNSPVFSTDVAFSSGGTITTSTTTTYTYATTSASSANPHAVIQITPASSGQATTTFVYDNNGNLIQSGTINGTTTYAWDYRNRMTDSATSTVTGTTTYLYDHSDQRVKKTFGNTVTTYVNKLYDLTTSTATTSASTTAYIWAGDMLVATIEGNGYSTSTYFVHPDHLGSANVITNSAGAVKQAIDYYPFGEERINTNSNLADRTFINQFYDREQSLSYLNARYLQSSRGQFLSQDPVFLSVGFKSFDKQFFTDPQQMNSARTMGGSNSGFASGWRGNTQSRAGSISQAEYLADPQMQNSYAYARGNPIRFSDPTGLWYQEFLTGQQSWSSFYGEVGEAANTLGQTSPAWNFAMNHPYTTGAVVGVASAGAAQAGLYGTVALKAAAYPGVGIGYSASRVAQGSAYLYLAQDSLRSISSTLTQFNNLNNATFGSSAKLIYNAGLQGASTFGGERVGGIADTLNLLSSTLRDLSKALSSISSQSSKK